ncbi:MAG TPA: hypothetical protein VGI65_00100 [Steroidobacteraceae bacterium]|jgi:ElaB/YqjD/DUF883 family membrane-anchored ribosome-binding protein
MLETTANQRNHQAHFDVAGSIRQAAREAAREARDTHAVRAAADLEVHNLIIDIEKLIERMKQATDPELTLVRAKVEASIAAVRQAIFDGAGQIQRQTQEAIEAGDNFIRERPWKAIGVASAAGLAIGLVLGRR